MGPESSIEHIRGRIGDIIKRFQSLDTRQSTSGRSPSLDPAPGGPHSLSSDNSPGKVAHSDTSRKAANFGFPDHLDRLLKERAQAHGVSPDLVRALVKAESGGNVHARSRVGATGLMQLMPATARELGVNPMDPAQNIDGGIRYLKSMARRFGDLDKTLAAYNAGPGAVQRYGGVPPYRETQNYVKKIRKLLGTPH